MKEIVKALFAKLQRMHNAMVRYIHEAEEAENPMRLW